MSDYKPSLRDEDAKPSKAIEAVVYEFGMRWKCPRDEHPDDYDARLRDLMRLCAGMAPGLLRAAGDHIAKTPRDYNILPNAGELHAAASEVIADRARRRARVEQEAYTGGHGYAATTRQDNLRLALSNAGVRWIDNNGSWSLVKVSGAGASHRCNGDGTVSAQVYEGGKLGWETVA